MRPFNLWEPVDRDADHTAHGRFDDKAHSRSAQWWWTTHRALVAAGAAVAGSIGLAARMPFRRR